LFEGIDSTGALLLRRADGQIETIRAGDVFLL
jgi:biotin-(acetyl-CoA carboxylase) ligase